MPEYKALGSPDTLEDAIEVIDELQEHQSRGVRFAPPTIEQILEAVTETGHVEGVSGKVGTVMPGRAGAAGNMLIVRGMTVAKSDNVVLTSDFTPTHEDDVLLLGSDGRKLRELSRLGSGVGQTFGCPFVVKGDGIGCFEIQNLAGTVVATVDTTAGPGGNWIFNLWTGKTITFATPAGPSFGDIVFDEFARMTADAVTCREQLFVSSAVGQGVNSDLIPTASDTHDLGNANQSWRRIFVQNITLGYLETAADLTISASSFFVVVTDVATASPRTITLPLATSVGPGSPLTVKDGSGDATIETGNDILIQRQGTDVIDGGLGLTQVNIASQNGAINFVSNGVDRWYTH